MIHVSGLYYALSGSLGSHVRPTNSYNYLRMLCSIYTSTLEFGTRHCDAPTCKHARCFGRSALRLKILLLLVVLRGLGDRKAAYRHRASFTNRISRTLRIRPGCRQGFRSIPGSWRTRSFVVVKRPCNPIERGNASLLAPCLSRIDRHGGLEIPPNIAAL